MVSLFAVAALFSCDEAPVEEPNGDDPNGEEPQVEEVDITISNVVATYNSVNFDVDAEGAKAISYMCVEKSAADGVTAESVFEGGKPSSNVVGSFSVSSLESSTEYVVMVATRLSNGFGGPQMAEFTTEENSGDPTSATSAGIRVDDPAQLVWEVTNGEGVDFSLTMVRPTILIDNYCFEAAKAGVTAEAYIKDFMLSNGYLCRTTTGAGVSMTHNFSEIYTATNIFPGANYSLFTLACEGDYNDESSIKALDLVRVDMTTPVVERIGSPDVLLECTSPSYISFRHKVTPNDDAEYWSSFFTKTAEIEEFRNYYNEKEGEGAGDARLTEYLTHCDTYVLEQRDPMEFAVTVGFDQQGIDFSRLALGFDKNTVPGDTYREVIDQVIKPAGEDGVYNMVIDPDSVGAGNFYMTTVLGPNTSRVFWKIGPKGSFDADLVDDNSAQNLARLLWDEAYGVWRGAGGDEANANQDITFVVRQFHFGEPIDSDLDIVATSLNYDGTLSNAKIITTIHTCGRSLGDYEPAIDISVDEKNISKTTIIANYDVKEDAYDKDARLYYHRIYRADELEGMDDSALREWLQSNHEVWSIFVEDESFEDPMHTTWTWAALESGTEYIYVWASEDGDGVMSNIDKIYFKTLDNNGGDNPYITIKVNPEDVTPYVNAGGEVNDKYFSAKATAVPNGDVVEYKCVFIDESVVKSDWYDPNDPASLQKCMYMRIDQNGLPANEIISLATSTGVKVTDRLWFMAQGVGANSIKSPLSYVCIHADGTIDEQIDVDTSVFAGVPYKYESASLELSDGVTSINDTKSCRRNVANQRQANIKTSGLQPAVRASELNYEQLREQGVPIYSLKEMTLKSLLKK